MAGNYVSAKNAKVRVGATTFYAKKWTATPKGQKLETTDFETAGFGTYLGGIVDLDVEIEAVYDIGSSPIATLFVSGSNTSNVKLYLNDTTGPYFNIPTLFVEEATVSAEVRGLVELKIKGCGNGIFTNPLT